MSEPTQPRTFAALVMTHGRFATFEGQQLVFASAMSDLEAELAAAEARIAELEAEIRSAVKASSNLWGEPITSLQGLARLVPPS